MIRLLIADDDKDFCTSAKALIELEPRLELTGIAENGEEAVMLSIQTRPDIILLDHCMPLVDGIGVIQRLQALPNPPLIFILSAWDINEILPESICSKITYAMRKPVEWNILFQRIFQFSGNFTSESHEQRIREHLKQYQIDPGKKAGILFLEALLLLCEQSNRIHNLSKNLYPLLSQKTGISTVTIQRHLNYEIERIFNHPNNDLFQKVFQKTSPQKGKMTNKQFLVLLAQELGFLS